MQALTFNKIAPMNGGRIDIKYRRIACQVPFNMTVIVDANVGAGGWLRLQVKVSSHCVSMVCFKAVARQCGSAGLLLPLCRRLKHSSLWCN